MDYKNGNGVKPRFDGRGDAWAMEHRYKLDRFDLMADVDAFIGVFAANGSERLFVEYAIDRSSSAVPRDFGVVALFDRKRNEQASNDSNITKEFYMWLCRALGRLQRDVVPQFWHVIGGDEPPWEMRRFDVTTGEVAYIGTVESQEEWRSMWSQAGIKRLRSLVEHSWLNGGYNGR